MRIRFILFVAARYFRTKRRHKRIAYSILSALGIAVGVMTLIVVMAVMNGFQLSFVEPILQVKSYHIQLSLTDGIGLSEQSLAAIRQMKNVSAVIPFVELQGIANTRHPCIIRAIPSAAIEDDRGFAESFASAFQRPDRETLGSIGTIVIGAKLAAQLGLREGDTISIFTMSGSSFDGSSPRGVDLIVSGLFKTGFYEIDLNWAFISLETAQMFEERLSPVYGIKLRSRFRVDETMRSLKDLLDTRQVKMQSWREFNRVFFGALLTEKLTMMFLIGLIFVVVGLNIFHSLRRAVQERMEEIATLKALGASGSAVKNIFISEGFMIGFFGSLAGMLLGLLVASNINTFFRLVEALANTFFIPLIEYALSPFGEEISIPPVSIFSPMVFYIDEVPVRVLLPESFGVCVVALLCSSLAAAFAANRVTRFRPAIIMRNE
jgi:lipoprotein-releasing system permease protein